MVTNALQNVTCHARVEELQGHGGEFYQEVCYELNINARVHVEHDPRTDVVDAQCGDEEPELGKKNQCDDI